MSRKRHSMAAGMREVAPILVGIVPFGLVSGALVIQAGFGLAEALGMSLFVNAGASQIVATQLFIDGAPIWITLGTALVVNLRMFIYSVSLAPVLESASWRLRPLLGHMLVDQNYAATMTRGRFRDDVDVVPYYMGAWIALAGTWQLSNIAGAIAGPFIPASWGLDFAVPLVFLALLAPTLMGRTAVGAAVVTGLTAAILVPVLPMQTGLVVAIVAGMVFGTWQDSRTAEEVSS
ncbi:MAG: AzlC family ABC transporter permease [Actinomycetota bacterium]|nr:AzlC family ABC transporter permease [Actinomycetota bacterium]